MPVAQRVKPMLSVIVLILVACFSVFAQTETATLSGVVQDPKGAVVPDVEVVATRIETGSVATTRTNSAGIYFFTGLMPGHYHLIVRKPGFKEIAIKEFQLFLQGKLEQNFSLEIGSVSETVTVTAGAPLVNTTDASVSTVIDREFVKSLPLNGRSFNTLLQLTPGVVIAPGAANPSDPGQFNVNGQRSDANYFVIDGVSGNFGVGSASSAAIPGKGGTGTAQAFNAYGGTSSLASVEAVEEFRVQTSSFAPEFGRAPGGQVTIETRSGTKDFHGNVFDYFRNDALDANDWFFNQAVAQASSGSLIPKPALRQNDFGGTLGGPIIHDKTFFFFSYEGLRVRQPETARILVPSLDLRASTLPSVAPFLNAYPLPNGAVSLDDTTAEFTGTFSNQITSNATSVRLDHDFSQKFRLFGRYNEAPSQTLGRGVSSNLAELDTQTIDTRTLTVGENSLLRSNLSVSFRGNYSRQSARSSSSLDSFGGAQVPAVSVLLPVPLTQQNGSADFTTIGLPAYFFGTGPKNTESQVNLIGDTVYGVGAHTLKFGADFRDLYLDLGGREGGLLYLNFSLQQFASSGTSSLFENSVRHASKLIYRSFSLYGQDTWKISNRLTATYGLRWELSPPPTGRDGTTLAAWANTGDLAAIGLAPRGTPLWDTRYDNFAPRVGLAYQLTQSGDLVMRGGWGMFYGVSGGRTADLGFLFPNTASFIGFNQNLPVAELASVTPSFSLAPPYPSFSEGFSSKLKLPVSYEWNVAIEKSFHQRQAVSITYVGQVGRDLLRLEELNEPNPNFSGIFFLTDNRDTSDFQALQVQYKHSLSGSLQFVANYTWSHSIDTSSSDALFSIPGQLYAVNGDRGSSDFDVRHNFSGGAAWNLPTFVKHGVPSALVRGWSLDAVMQARTAFPIDVLTSSVPLAGTQVSTRPDLVPGVSAWLYGSQYPGGKALNPSAFAIPQAVGQGNLGRNSLRGFGFTQLDFSLGRRFNFSERAGLQFRADMFNIFNHPNFANPDNNIDDGPLFGLSSQMLNQSLGGLNALYQIGGPRSLQLSLKFEF